MGDGVFDCYGHRLKWFNSILRNVPRETRAVSGRSLPFCILVEAGSYSFMRRFNATAKQMAHGSNRIDDQSHVVGGIVDHDDGAAVRSQQLCRVRQCEWQVAGMVVTADCDYRVEALSAKRWIQDRSLESPDREGRFAQDDD